MTAQEIFDKVVDHLRRQGKKARSASGRCMYRTHSNEGTILKCAIGCLIPDDEYSSKMEGANVNKCMSYSPTLYRLLVSSDVELAYVLQFVHDTKDVDAWEESFKQVAKDHELVYKRVGVT